MLRVAYINASYEVTSCRCVTWFKPAILKTFELSTKSCKRTVTCFFSFVILKMADRDALIQQFIETTNEDVERAQFFLEIGDWDIKVSKQDHKNQQSVLYSNWKKVAVSKYYEFGGGIGSSQSPRNLGGEQTLGGSASPAAGSSSSAAPPMSSGKAQSSARKPRYGISQSKQQSM